MEILKGKTALITGAGKGLGRAIAILLAKEGVHLALTSRTLADLEQVAADVKAIDPGLRVAITLCDVSDAASVQAAAKELKRNSGPIDILVNNAGVGKFGNFMDLGIEEWEQIVKTNLFGAYYWVHEILPEMKERKTGDIVNVSSTAGLKGAAMTSAYSASKFGLIGMSESLMMEVRKENIRVMTMTPSTIATDMAINLKLTDGNPARTLQSEDFAELLVAHLKLPRRAMVKEVSLWSTNP